MLRWFLKFSFMTLVLTSHSLASPCLERAQRISDPIKRDLSIIRCTEKQAQLMTTQQCLKAAQSLHYESHSDRLRSTCLEKAKDQNVKTCSWVQKSFQDSDANDDAGWYCLRRYNLTMTASQCAKLAQQMSTYSQENRALSYCLHEIKSPPTQHECQKISKKLYPDDGPELIRSYCQKLVEQN